MHLLFIGLGVVVQPHLHNSKAKLGSDLRASAYRVRREGTALSDQLQVVEGKSLDEECGIEVYDTLEAALAQEPEVWIVVECVRTRRPPLVDLDIGTRSLRLGLALRDSLHSGQACSLVEGVAAA